MGAENFFFEDYMMVYPHVITSLCWRHNHVFLQRLKNVETRESND